jgi:hypothetical protein
MRCWGSHTAYTFGSQMAPMLALRASRRFTPQKRYSSVSGTHFCSRLSKHQGLVRPEGLGN